MSSTETIVAQPLARTPLVQVIRDEERRHKQQVVTGTRVSIAALHFNPPQTHPRDAHAVWVVDGQSLRQVPVKIGISDGEYTAVEATDLPQGTTVIVELSAVGRTAYGLGK